MIDAETLSTSTGVDLEVSNLICDIEKKHGHQIHMVIEPVFDGETNKQYGWWIEFENNSRLVETLDEVKKYFLEEMVAKGGGPVVEFTNIEESDSYEIVGIVDD